MTPECPKGPESEARSPKHGDRVRAFVEGVWDEEFISPPWIRTASDAMVRGDLSWTRLDVLDGEESEVERLTATVGRLTLERDRFGELHLAEAREHDKTATWWREAMAERDGALAEVSRLREQLAAQPTEAQWKDAQSEIERLEGNESFLERAVHFVLDCCDGSDVPCESDAAEVLYERVRRDIAPAAQQQHKVEVKPQGGDWWKAECAECDLANYTRRRSEAENWKDQHEADTLRPKFATGGPVNATEFAVSDEPGPPGFVIPQRPEGRPSGSKAAEPRPVVQEEYIVRTADNSDLPQRIKKVGVHRPAWVDVDCPSCGDAGGCGHADLLCCEECDDNWPCNVVANVAEELERMAFRVEGEPVRVLIGRARELRGDAAQAARSEATPRVWTEVDLQPCPEGVRQVRDCNNFVWRRLVNDQWVTGHQGDGPCGWPYLIKKFGPLTEVPSPSLRKEGEDAPSPAVSSQEEKKEGGPDE